MAQKLKFCAIVLLVFNIVVVFSISSTSGGVVNCTAYDPSCDVFCGLQVNCPNNMVKCSCGVGPNGGCYCFGSCVGYGAYYYENDCDSGGGNGGPPGTVE